MSVHYFQIAQNTQPGLHNLQQRSDGEEQWKEESQIKLNRNVTGTFVSQTQW